MQPKWSLVSCRFNLLDVFGMMLLALASLRIEAASLRHRNLQRADTSPKTDYDSCVLEEFTAAFPEKREPGLVATSCYIDCLKKYATFAPRMCYRHCVNALLNKPICAGAKEKAAKIATSHCATSCPVAAFNVGLAPGFCPPQP